MGEVGFFDIFKRYAGLDAKPDQLVKLNALVLWVDFRPRLEAVWRGAGSERLGSPRPAASRGKPS